MDFWTAFSQNIFTQIIGTILLTFGAQLLLRQFTGRLVRRAVRSHHYQNAAEERQREDTLISILNTAGAVLVWTIGVIAVLNLFNVNVGALLTGAGLLGIVIGFGAQNTVKDFLSGMFIILENQYRVGDIVTIGTISGMVEGISIRLTKLRDLDGTLHFIPNGAVNIVSNLTFGYANVNINIGVGYDSDIKKVENVINKVGEELASDNEWKKSIMEPIQFLRVDSFDDSAVTVKALGKVMPATQWDVAGEFRKRVKVAFDKNGIVIPFPQRVIHQARK